MVNFETATYDELDEHAMQQLVMDNSAVSAILRGHLFVEGVIEQLVRRALPKPDAIMGKGNLNFDMKIDLARALDVLSDQHVSQFRAINRIRNRYAHDAGYQVTVAELNAFKFDWAESQNKAFEVSVARGPDEAARIATVFLCWEALSLIKTPIDTGSVG
ncbi:hypothetical protein [Ciceribacter ferrooxidans]|uniref:DUF4145 domain-containing protein n=1 Tax=Ciceribacter ferrooxidans TaxID=2509717 RepID=A0A4Q2TE95_9HYPH|nr:hypothetical protein [Ciceribacter ferrooxidans]RYC17652.1 hypothetical protein EUU22_06660 [Ciceribacter ferrooxidans]